MDQQKQKLIERIGQAQNILVTVSANPTVDQLSAAIGLTIALNKLDKHGTAVFSGQIPSTIDFLKPEATLEKNTDSLRDFIIALDKSKADKLRYKVEDQVVRIFITPYKTSLSEKDLDFSQGDFNVDVVIALGVNEQTELDSAITAHGRILHDATVASISTVAGKGNLGTINWIDTSASSLSEMAAALTDGLDKKLMDNQIATAFLTGIVASTERFRNDKTSPRTMSVSALLMAAGANQQLIASELETPAEPVLPPSPYSAEPIPNQEPAPQPVPAKAEPGVLEIDHDHDPAPPVTPEADEDEPMQNQIHVDEDGQLITEAPKEPLPEISRVRGVGTDGTPTTAKESEVTHERLDTPPMMGDTDLTANTEPEGLDPAAEELTLPALDAPLLTHNANVLPPAPEPPKPVDTNPFIPQEPLPTPPSLLNQPMPAPQSATVSQPEVTLPPLPTFEPTPQPPAFQPTPPAPSFTPPAFSADSTLSDIEKSIGSPHAQQAATPVADVDSARNAVEAAFATPAAANTPEPIAALNAQPLGGALHQPVVANTGFSEPTPGNTPADDTLDMPMPSNPFGPGQQFTPPAPSSFPGMLPQPTPTSGQTAPPPVPPPIVPPLQ